MGRILNWMFLAFALRKIKIYQMQTQEEIMYIIYCPHERSRLYIIFGMMMTHFFDWLCDWMCVLLNKCEKERNFQSISKMNQRIWIHIYIVSPNIQEEEEERKISSTLKSSMPNREIRSKTLTHIYYPFN